MIFIISIIFKYIFTIYFNMKKFLFIYLGLGIIHHRFDYIRAAQIPIGIRDSYTLNNDVGINSWIASLDLSNLNYLGLISALLFFSLIFVYINVNETMDERLDTQDIVTWALSILGLNITLFNIGNIPSYIFHGEFLPRLPELLLRIYLESQPSDFIWPNDISLTGVRENPYDWVWSFLMDWRDYVIDVPIETQNRVYNDVNQAAVNLVLDSDPNLSVEEQRNLRNGAMIGGFIVTLLVIYANIYLELGTDVDIEDLIQKFVDSFNQPKN
jgi:hypothetical protein